MPLSEVVENLKLSLVGLCQTFDVHVKCPLCLVEDREVVIGGTLPNFRCACQVPLVFVGCDRNGVTGSVRTLHGVSVVSIQELPEYTIVLRHERHSHLSMLKIRGQSARRSCHLVIMRFHHFLVDFLSQSQGVVTISWLCVRKTIVRLFVLSVLALAQQLCNTFLKHFVHPCSYISLAVSLTMHAR